MNPVSGLAERIAAQGPLGKLTAALDGASPLGPVDGWSPILVSTVQLMLSSRAEIVLFWGQQLCALYNDAYAPTIGDKHPHALGRPARDGWAELWDDLGPLLQSVLEQGKTIHAKDRPFYIERDKGRGEEVFFDISYSPVFEADGSIGGVLCIVSETTRRVLAERQTTAERDRLWSLARDPFLITDTNGIWLAASPAWSDILGWPLDQLVGSDARWIEHPDDIARTRAQLGDILSGDASPRYENRYRTTDGLYRTFSWTSVLDGDRIYCVARDVTEHRAEARARAEAEAALRQAQKMETLGQLTGGVAHDFNNLLQVVTGNLELLQRSLPTDPPRLKRAADNAMAGAERAAILTQRLLAFSRRQPLSPQPMDPNRLIAGMSDLFQRTLGETIEVRSVPQEGAWTIEVDHNQMENALLNLAVNARDAMPGGGKLDIEIDNIEIDSAQAVRDGEMPPGQYVRISLSDSGAGMDADTLRHAVEPFFTTKDVGRGTGLGLSMVYGFIKQSGGHLQVYSEPGQGTCVKLYLPRHHGVPPVENSDEPTPPQTIGGTETILLCEDDDNVRAYSAAVLRDLGYRVVEAGDAAQALGALGIATDPIDLLFTDVVLPGGMSGADLAREAHIRTPDLKILFTTGYARNAIIHQGRLEAGVELLTKPFTYSELAAKVRAMLDRHPGQADQRP
ncbi:hybrid sensor histidine kinase/response regulator [Sphingobium sp. TCM1]|uniref:hybrid sensor histidine kinase/response regulator n=1 Tax=Sphingobium sp. TCM1 TaxID=453246 RepID=UPI0007F4D7E9|nr:PAS domain-containing sensor histidine kinase [Sphingobium sp. TCM1]OAN57933.1 hybrid sensor histidine kinase/response regulator [Sphingobium sp. TCM1]